MVGKGLTDFQRLIVYAYENIHCVGEVLDLFTFGVTQFIACCLSCSLFSASEYMQPFTGDFVRLGHQLIVGYWMLYCSAR